MNGSVNQQTIDKAQEPLAQKEVLLLSQGLRRHVEKLNLGFPGSSTFRGLCLKHVLLQFKLIEFPNFLPFQYTFRPKNKNR